MNMSNTEQIAQAIAESIAEDRIVTVEVEADAGRSLEETTRSTISSIVDDSDCANENDGSLDVWGSCDGADFRIQVVRI